jgi:hypothetical protein
LVVPYLCPVGYTKVPVRTVGVPKTPEEFDKKVAEWPVVYHGTKITSVDPIMKDGLRGSRNNVHVKDGLHVYFSPSIEYSSHPRYAKWFKAADGRYYQAVLQIRVNQKKINAMGAESLRLRCTNDVVIDPRFRNSEDLEWIISLTGQQTYASSDDVIVAGILLRCSLNPFAMPQMQWWVVPYMISWSSVPTIVGNISDAECCCWELVNVDGNVQYKKKAPDRRCLCLACAGDTELPPLRSL